MKDIEIYEVNYAKMLNILNEHGVVKINGWLSDLSDLKKEVLEVISSGKEYQFGKFFKLGELNKKQLQLPYIYKTFKQNWMKKLAEDYLQSNVKFCHQVIATHDYRTDKGLGRNGYLHFDRTHEFKFFLYLRDCKASDGPFSCVPGSHRLGAELRRTAWKENREYAKVKNRVLFDYQNMGSYKSKIVPILASAGDLVIFDTDTFHMGGLTKGGERLIIRSHTRRAK